MKNHRIVISALSAAAVGAAIHLAAAPAQAQEPVCPEGTYWNAALAACVDVDVYVNPPNPVVGPAGPIGVGGVVGPAGPGPVGPGPAGPGPAGPGPR
ncbi:hypothetical protein CRI77_19210 [Mycolicibacterium duvalii]|uniref:Uncharacterized protein n=1 Tax=Mycolicibacterium duvalii TaxID=39688 RepID=A0A7I7JWK6_9MYCO|nr:hypothetical protein [Mycolicibacterium duvalii]MCV7370397.1 hypothetical protein [Mycolicibacterium duvalii]PEG38164.1 hypothetical protein CRI77_19210 [Mycolicibacterium duvalii]BBX15768.1 hypothetical protein MDUV_06280 [Mycolicibacterium duvalii]